MIAEAYDAQILIETKREEDESLQFMKKILHYLEQHYQEKIKIQQLADFIGLDVCLSILNVMYEGFKNPKYAPCPLLVNMVTAKN